MAPRRTVGRPRRGRAVRRGRARARRRAALKTRTRRSATTGSKGGGAAAPPTAGRHRLGTAGGVDTAATKEHLLGIARRLDVRGRSRMTKAELVEAVARANDRATARSRERDQDR